MLEIGIVNYNGGDALKQCILSLLAQNQPVQIHIWDNCSTDQDYRSWQKDFPTVQFHFGHKNLGYAFACNRLAEQFTGEYFALANMDCIFEANWAKTIQEHLQQFPHIDALGSLVLESHPNGDCTINAYSVKLHSDLHPLSPEDGLAPGEVDLKIQKSFAIYGAVMVFKKSSYELVEGMDESYFLYYEEADLFWKFNLFDLHVELTPNAVVKHFRSWSTGSFSLLKLFYSERNRIRSAVKYLPLIQLACLPFKSVLRIQRSMTQNKRLSQAQQKPPFLSILSTLIQAWIKGFLFPIDWKYRFKIQKKIPHVQQKTMDLLKQHLL